MTWVTAPLLERESMLEWKPLPGSALESEACTRIHVFDERV
jgi:hypothetical protein